MTQVYADDLVELHHGDCLDVMATMPDASVHAVVTDPPYLLGFMGRQWDTRSAHEHLEWHGAWAAQAFRLLKPGGHLLAFGGTRTWHRLAVAIEDAGFEIRDSIAWLYGSGFPKSLDVSKAIDRATGAEREVVGRRPGGFGANSVTSRGVQAAMGYRPAGEPYPSDADPSVPVTAPATPDAARWQGWGTALKPSHEPIVHGVKPYGQRDILDLIGSHLDTLGDSCRHGANGAAQSSAPTPAGSPAERAGTAPGSVVTLHVGEPASATPTGLAGGSSAQTGTSPSGSTVATYSNTVTSWRACWVELWEATSTSTTSTATRPTTDLATLWSSLSRITPDVMAQSMAGQEPSRSLVQAVDNLFAASVLNSRSTRALSAIGTATSPTPVADRPAFEPIVVARKPLAGTVAQNVLTHGTGALNVDGCRVGYQSPEDYERTARGTQAMRDSNRDAKQSEGWDRPWQHNTPRADAATSVTPAGRWPPNAIFDDTAAAELDRQSGDLSVNGPAVYRRDKDAAKKERSSYVVDHESGDTRSGFGDSGGASRFFPTFRYEAKAPTEERPRAGGVAHPTVKPLDLMRWLVRLVTPPGGTILDPFAGSGTTAEAAVIEGFRCVTIEREADYLPLILARLTKPIEPVLDLGALG